MQGPYTHLSCHNALFIYKTYVSHQFTELYLQDMSYPRPPLGSEAMFELGGGVEEGRAQLKQGFHFFTFWDKEADFFLSLN